MPVATAQAPEMESPRVPVLQYDPEAAKVALEEGRDAYAIGDYAKARERLALSVALDATDGAELYLAMAEEKLGHSDVAAVHYQSAYDLAVARGNPRALFARQKLQNLKLRVGP